jgi:signal transduction histidine kinase/DNA-binding response OmpR family regulator
MTDEVLPTVAEPGPTGTPTATVLGTVTVGSHDHVDTGWSRVRDLAQTGGLAPLPAARLALAATGLLSQPRSPFVVQVTRHTDHNGTRIEAVIRGSPSPGIAPLLAELVDSSSQRTSPTGAPEQVLSITGKAAPAPHQPSWTALSDAAAQASNTRQLLAVALVAASRQSAYPGTVNLETTALRLELDETNRGMLALHAELSHRQEQLEQARAVAEQASLAKAAFLATMSHEIRSPMTAVVGFTGLLLETDLLPEQREYANAVQTAGGHLLGVIDDVLDLSKIESGRLELEDIPFDLYACVEDAVGILALKAAEKHLPLAALFAPDTPHTVRGDPLRLGQILVNLLANAIKFTTRGQVTVEVTHQFPAATCHRLTFRVNDTGEGIPTEALARLFTPFTQADTSTTRIHGGTGLGLSICRQLAEQMGGTINVESTVGQGSTFACTIDTRVSPANPAATDRGLLAGVHVLVLHKHHLTVEAVCRHLVSWGAVVTTGSDVDEAISHANHGPRIDLAVVDAAVDLARLADAYRHAPIIAMTALTDRRIRARVGHASISTPIRRAYLREVILAVLDARPKPAVLVAPAMHKPLRILTNDDAFAATAEDDRRVLYVDDNPMNIALVERIFSKDPHVILHTALDGRTALRLATDQQPDIILLDLNLTDIGGDEVLRELHANTHTESIPVVIVSGDAAPATIERLSHLGAAGYLAKPFQAAQLRELVNSTQRRTPPISHLPLE